MKRSHTKPSDEVPEGNGDSPDASRLSLEGSLTAAIERRGFERAGWKNECDRVIGKVDK